MIIEGTEPVAVDIVEPVPNCHVVLVRGDVNVNIGVVPSMRSTLVVCFVVFNITIIIKVERGGMPFFVYRSLPIWEV